MGYIYHADGTITKVQITDNLMLSDARNKQGFSRRFYVGSTSPAKIKKTGVYTPNPTDNKLQKYQWDLIHNPESMVGWLQDEEEGEYQNFEVNMEAIAQKEKYIEIFYNLINKSVISVNENASLTGERPMNETALIKATIRKYIYVDPYDYRTCIFVPDNEFGIDCIEISLDITGEILKEVYPFLLQSAA